MKMFGQILIGLLASALMAAAQTNLVTEDPTNKPAATATDSNALVASVAAFTEATAGTTEAHMVVAPDLGGMTSSNLVEDAEAKAKAAEMQQYLQAQMDMAIKQRHEKNPGLAIATLTPLMDAKAPPEFKRKALFELALATQDNNDYVKAQQIYAQYLQRYTDDPSAPEVMLRQGLLFRLMGANTLAISKFYSVMSTAIKLPLASNIEYYKDLVLQAETEIADTYYIEGQFNESADFYTRLLKEDSPILNKPQIEFKLIRSYAYVSNETETIIRAQKFLERYPNYSDLPEVRFLLATAYKSEGRNSDALKQVLLLLQSQQTNAQSNPELWTYWQRRAGNEIANQLYKEADFMDALQIYQNLAALDPAPSWQAPALYQVGLVYEQLQQWQKATDTYGQILARRAELTGSNAPPSLNSLCEMAQWRKDYIAWLQKARAADQEFQHSNLYKPPGTNAVAIVSNINATTAK